ncbi:hypothetical protein [Myxacorys almedinensis]|uniref:Uncharacterized protein n=1 Tax=Myxacorys almedinensis A TaxID=2690445 RepID=A0A8J7YX10_9CYAN|nr:hypothetical protein [Myxacorys almedinensis]NDJ16192.1 hypothetical protein [Myxacorys almedinensis A]
MIGRPAPVLLRSLHSWLQGGVAFTHLFAQIICTEGVEFYRVLVKSIVLLARLCSRYVFSFSINCVLFSEYSFRRHNLAFGGAHLGCRNGEG